MKKSSKLWIIGIIGIILAFVGILLIESGCRWITYSGEGYGGGYNYCPYESLGTVGLIVGGVLIAFAILVAVTKSFKYFLKDESK
ncbi:hypothetical protein HYW76_02670 [Candidatus Pacearchaeota archaeon]|nr:hypothetical protein [Candidatus Pacearchaeota archaeon]